MNKPHLNTFWPNKSPFLFEMNIDQISYSFPAVCHWHSNMEFYTVLSGTLECLLHGKLVRLSTGESVFINCGTLHMISNAEEMTAKVFILQLPAVLWAEQIFPNQQIPTFMTFRPAEEVSRLLCQLNSLFQSGSHNTECSLTIVEKILSDIEHKLPETSAIYFQTKSDCRQAETTKEILDYMHTHFREKISMQELSRELYIGLSDFFHCFKHFTNTTPVQYLNSFRLMKAEALLRDTQSSIYEICEACGFYSIGYFGRIFKKRYRLSPIQYRKKSSSANPSFHTAEQSLRSVNPA